MNIPYNINDLSIFFFAKGRPYNVGCDNPNFEVIKLMLLTGIKDQIALDNLIEFADVTAKLTKSGLTLDGDDVFWNGEALHNVWVDKILAFNAEGLNHDPIFKALENLQTNPTPAARERLPIFVERSQLGFLPDGRIAAYKGVRADYMDVHSGTVSYAIGSTVSMDRELCNSNPDQTCTAGLHLGAIDYIKQRGYGWGSDRRLLLCAFWPKDVVAVPTDYRGGKMRVCSLEVIEEVDRAFADEHMGFNRTLVGHQPQPVAAPVQSKPPHMEAEIGDQVVVGYGSSVPPGTYTVTDLELPPTSCRVRVKYIGSTNWAVFDQAILSVVKKSELPIQSVATSAVVGDYVRIAPVEDDSDVLKVIRVDQDSMIGYHLLVVDECGSSRWLQDNEVLEIVTNNPVYRAHIGDDVHIKGCPDIVDGWYSVEDIDPYDTKSRIWVFNDNSGLYSVRKIDNQYIVAYQ